MSTFCGEGKGKGKGKRKKEEKEERYEIGPNHRTA